MSGLTYFLQTGRQGTCMNGPQGAAHAPDAPTRAEPLVHSERTVMLAPPARDRVNSLANLALRGLPTAYLTATSEFAQTVRAFRTPDGVALRAEGTSPRYAAIVALGLAWQPEAVQRAVLHGLNAAELAALVAERAAGNADPGAVALGAWAAAEVRGQADSSLLTQIESLLVGRRPLPTVDVAWMLTAALASTQVARSDGAIAASAAAVQRSARDRLLAAQSPQGLFPHALPAASLGRWRAHVGCYADQVYPIQALARLAVATDDTAALTAANSAAARIVELQGDAGQWWWHYDTRVGGIVEGYPVYSVHQHAMGPMALFDLLEAGGDDHREAITRGLGWLDQHPEVLEDLVSERHALVWRKVGRREPSKAARKLAAVTTTFSPGLHVPGINTILPPTEVDHECRPYELGWLLYAWRSAGVVRALAPQTNVGETSRGPA